MEFAVFTPLVEAAGVEVGLFRLAFREGGLMALEHFLGDFFDAYALDAGGGPGEIFFDELGVESNGLENLCPVVTGDRGDAHLGHGFNHALDGAFDVFLDGGLELEVGQESLMDHVRERFECEVGIDGGAAISDEGGEVVDFSWFSGFEDESDAGASALADEVMMEAGDCEQCGHGGVLGIDAAVGEYENIGSVLDVLVSACEELFQGFLEGVGAFFRWEDDGQRYSAEAGAVHMAELFQLVIGEQRAAELDHAAAFGFRVKEVALASDHDFRGGDEFFADGVDGRVCDLGEELFEVAVEQLGFVGEHCEGVIGSHGSDRLYAIAGHWADDEAQVFVGVTEGLLPEQDRSVVRFVDRRRIGQFFQKDVIFVEPVLVGFRLGVAGFEFVVSDDSALLHVDEEHPTGLQAAFGGYIFRLDGEDAGFGGHDDEVIFGDVVS